MSKYPGLFVTIEGGEGAGKSVLSANIAKNINVRCTREPGGSPFGEFLRPLLLDPSKVLGSDTTISPYTELFLFLALRSQHLHDVILPALSNGEIVVCERYSDSTIVYQGFACGLPVDYVDSACKMVYPDLPEPDLTFLLDIDCTDGISRKKLQFGELDSFERREMEFHKFVREGFLQQAKKCQDRIIVLDASDSIENIAKIAISEIKKRANILSTV